MELSFFKKTLNEIFTKNHFRKKGGYYYLSNDEIVFIIGLQKSNYSNGYYINLGYVLKEINTTSHDLRDVDGDLRRRFYFTKDNIDIDFFDLYIFSDFDYNILTDAIQYNIDTYIKPATSINSLKQLLNAHPTMLYQATLRAKQFLGYN